MTLYLGTSIPNGRKVHLPTNGLTTHMAILGATGSGKSGFIFGTAEEITRQGIPVVLVDIKGDGVNIVDQDDPPFIARYITPGGSHGESVNCFARLEDNGDISQAVSGLLQMINEDADPLTSRVHSYLSAVLQFRHERRFPCQLYDVIHAAQDPGFRHLGALDIDQAFPKRSRVALAAKLNTLFVSPSYAAWRKGIKLDITEFVQPVNGKPPLTVYSVSHITNQTEQNFALTELFAQLVTWTKSQPGSKDLRLAVVIDECVGLLPPHPKNPSTKQPLMTLLKQARAYGVGLLLASQNPVDLDYKALSNCGIWGVGRLAMERDRQRVLKGICANVSVTYDEMERRLAGLQPQEFMLVKKGSTVKIKTRDVEFPLAGPILPDGIRDLYTKGNLDLSIYRDNLQDQLRRACARLAGSQSQENHKVIAELESQIERVDRLIAAHEAYMLMQNQNNSV